MTTSFRAVSFGSAGSYESSRSFASTSSGSGVTIVDPSNGGSFTNRKTAWDAAAQQTGREAQGPVTSRRQQRHVSMAAEIPKHHRAQPRQLWLPLDRHSSVFSRRARGATTANIWAQHGTDATTIKYVTPLIQCVKVPAAVQQSSTKRSLVFAHFPHGLAQQNASEFAALARRVTDDS